MHKIDNPNFEALFIGLLCLLIFFLPEFPPIQTSVKQHVKKGGFLLLWSLVTFVCGPTTTRKAMIDEENKSKDSEVWGCRPFLFLQNWAEDTRICLFIQLHRLTHHIGWSLVIIHTNTCTYIYYLLIPWLAYLNFYLQFILWLSKVRDQELPLKVKGKWRSLWDTGTQILTHKK